MDFRVLTSYEEQILKVSVRTRSPQKIWVVVADADPDVKHTVFTNRWQVVNGDKNFYIRMPLSPKVSLVQVYNETNKNSPDDGFEMIGDNNGITRMSLEKKMDVVDMNNSNVRQFVSFAQKFCYNAGWLKAGNYRNGSGRFNINFQTSLYKKNGNETNTPARIGEETGIIDVSQKLFIPYTVPMRFAVLCHEFSHFYRNTNMYSETEADLQGLLIYLGLGYPRYEAYQAFLEIFAGTPSDLNAKRRDIVKRFITDFETHKFLIYD